VARVTQFALFDSMLWGTKIGTDGGLPATFLEAHMIAMIGVRVVWRDALVAAIAT
jgi:hypothetical protein